MTIWTPELDPASGPKYLALADAIAEGVSAGTLAAGTKLPTHRDLAYRLGITVGTVTRAYGEAERRGLLVGEVGRGTFVRGETSDRERSPYGSLSYAVEEMEDDNGYDFRLNLPTLAGLGSMLNETLADISRTNDINNFMFYKPHGGMDAHRSATVDWFKSDGVTATAENITITAGGQNAMASIFMSLCAPGDTVLAEALTYPGMKILAAQLGLRLHGLEMDEDGILPDALDEAARTTRARFLYAMPGLQNPTATVMPEDRRRQIAKIARKHDLFIIDDAAYNFMIENDAPTFASLAPERTLHLLSASKCMAPGLRIGAIHSPEALTPRIHEGMRAMSWMAVPLMAEVVARWITDGTAATLRHDHRREARARQETARALLGNVLGATRMESYHAWLTLPDPWRANDFADSLRKESVFVQPAETFAAGRTNPPHAVRICLGSVGDRARMKTGLERIANTMNGQAGCCGPSVV